MRRLATFVLTAALALAPALYAQRAMTVAQLTAFIKSSVEERLGDKQIAETLKKIHLTEKLEPDVISELMSMGAGPRTSGALRDLAAESNGLPSPGSGPANGAPVKAVRMVTEPDADQQKEILLQVREYALGYSQSLPNFICNQVTERKEDPSGSGQHYRSVDRLQEQLTYYDHQEKYKVVAVNGVMQEVADRTKLGGAISQGEFGSMMREIFDPETDAEFHWDALHKLDGVIMNGFSYRIPVERSHYTIYHSGIDRRITAGYHGLIYARQSDNAIMYITLICDDIPRGFPVQEVSERLWYGGVKISDRDFLLPLKWESQSRDGSVRALNTAEFKLYRKYETSATIDFGTDTTDDNQKKPDEKKPDDKKPAQKKKDPPPVKQP